MPVDLNSPPVSPQRQPTPAPGGEQRSDRGYRLLFYAATLVAIVTSWYAWNVSQRPLPKDLTAYAFERDKQYPFIIEAYGYKYRGHTGTYLDEYALRYGAFEKDRLFFVRDYLNSLGDKNAVVIDIGANTGHHTLFYSRHSARVLAFEPYPPVIADFKHNMALNPHVKNVELFEVGLGDADAELPFAAPADNNTGQGSFRVDTMPNPGMKRYEQKLRIVVGDEFLKDKNVGPVAFIKVDVEGFEESVLKGLRQTIERHRPLLEIEVSPPPVGTIDSFTRFRSLFPEDYAFFVLPWTVDGVVKGRYQLSDLDTNSIPRKDQIEIIACPKERLSLLPGR